MEEVFEANFEAEAVAHEEDEADGGMIVGTEAEMPTAISIEIGTGGRSDRHLRFAILKEDEIETDGTERVAIVESLFEAAADLLLHQAEDAHQIMVLEMALEMVPAIVEMVH